jgi:ABC-2 type transport system ATP-binding protein
VHTPAVDIVQVRKSFGATLAVSDLSLRVPQGSICGFIGPNGSGKTTTLRMITGIIRPDSGQLLVFGESPGGTRSRRIGYLPEERGLYRRMKVRALLRFFGELKTGRRVDAEVETWIRRLELVEHAEKKVEALSKGTAQRVQFIAAVVSKPDLVILDEPFSGLDPVNAEILRAALLDLHREGATVILSTHDMAIAEQLCDSVLMIFRGNKVLDGTIQDIRSRFGVDTVRIRAGIAPEALRTLPGVLDLRDLGQLRELRLRADADPQAMLRAALEIGPVHHFEVTQPTLHDIFVRIAAPSNPSLAHA